MKHLILLSLLFYLASCVEGEQKVVVSTEDEGVTPPIEISQTTTTNSPPALPIPSNFAFTSIYCHSFYCPQNQYPFLQNTRATLEVQITNPSNVPFSVEWSVALNNGVPFVDQVDNDQLISNYSIGMGNPLFSSLGFYTIVSSLKDSDGLLISNLVWSVEVVGDKPSYASFNPPPSPTPYAGSPFSASNSTPQTISAIISNPSVVPLNNFWYLDGVLQGTATDHTVTNVSFSFTPSSMSTGNHTVVAQLTDNPATGTIYNTATWSFEVTELPQFSTFSNPQLPSPAPFPNIEFGSNEVVNLDPNLVYNPSNATFTVYWEVDGAIDPSATFYGDQFNNDPDPFIISATDTNFSPGRHSVVAILVDESSSTSTVVDSASWNFTVVFPPPATLVAVYPATSTELVSVTGIPMNLATPMGGFFIGPSTPDSRGIPIVVVPGASTDTFCVQVSDGRGVGDPAPGSGVIVQYTYSDASNINTAPLEFPQSNNPSRLCLDGTGASITTAANGVPGFSLSPLGPNYVGPDYIEATITDKLSLQVIGVVRWNFSVEEVNTPPTLSISGPTLFSTSTTVNVFQDQPYTYTFTVEDEDCHPADSNLNCYTSNFIFQSDYGIIPLNGTASYYPAGPSSPTTPDCTRDFDYSGADKFSCTIIVPSNDGINPIPATGTFRITASVTNASIWNYGSETPVDASGTYFTPVTPLPILLTWDLNVIEGNIGVPTLENIITSGPADPSTNSYVYSATPTVPNVAAEFAVEGDTLMFNLNVDDPEKDDYRVEIFYDTSASPTVYVPIPGYATSTVYSISPVPIQIAPFTLPFSMVTGVATATINLKVVLYDVPDTSTPLNSIDYIFPITVSNVNPIPEVVTGTELPALTATGTVMQGFPYTMSADITDGSPGGKGAGLIWQWMVNQNSLECSSQSALSWVNIDGATQGTAPLPQPQTATLTWSPPSNQISGIPPSTTFCFRNCIGDDEFPPLNTLDCSPTMAGPWIGGILGTQADTTSALLAPYLQPDRPETAVWADPVNIGEVYGLHVYGNSIFLMKYIYNLDTTISQSGFRFPTLKDEPYTASAAEGAKDLSITGNSQYIFVSYIFNSQYFFPPYVSIPTNTVARIKRDFSSIDYFVNGSISSSVGQVIANEAAFWVPFINASVNNSPFYFAGDGTPASTSTNSGTFGIGLPSTDIESRERDGNLYMALKLDDGTVNLYKYLLPASFSSPTLEETDLDIFSLYYVPFSDMSLAVGPSGTNANVFVAGINTSTSTRVLFYGVKPIVSLGDGQPFTVPDISSATIIYPKTNNPQGLNAVASEINGEVLLGFSEEETTLRAPFAYIYILKVNGTDPIFPELNLSTVINQSPINIPVTGVYKSNYFALTNVIPNFEIGTAGAVPGENTKSTLWLRYHYVPNEDRLVIINVQDETFSSSTATLGPGDAWSTPWFSQ